MWPYVLGGVILAAIFKAVGDTFAHHFSISIFKRWNPEFWDATVSHRVAKTIPFTAYKLDGWHLSKSAMITSFCLAIVFHQPIFAWYIELLIAGVVFILVFNLFYNIILID